jgi:outer membrane lipopolysaccharide assembly protein LptE/RlpB
VRKFLAFVVMVCLAVSGCGYHTAGHSTRLPENLHVLAIPVFTNTTQTYRIEQILSRQVVREFVGRTHYQVVPAETDTADAKLQGTVLTAVAAPLTYDAHSGRISSAVVTVTMKITVTDRSGRVLFENQNYTFREQYQVSREVTSFFEEETPALERMSREFARTLVTDILEAF